MNEMQYISQTPAGSDGTYTVLWLDSEGTYVTTEHNIFVW